MKKICICVLIVFCSFMSFSQSVTITPGKSVSEGNMNDNVVINSNQDLLGLQGLRHNGTFAAKTPVQSSNRLLTIGAGGYYTPISPRYESSSIMFLATQNWATNNYGSSIAFFTTPNSSTAATDARMLINHDGFIGMGTNTPQSNLQIHQPTASSSNLQLTNLNTGSTLTDGLKIGINPNSFISQNAYIVNQENSLLSLGTNANTFVNLTADFKMGIGSSNIAPVGVFDIQHSGSTSLPHSNFRTTSDASEIVSKFENSTGTRNFTNRYYLGSATASSNYFDIRYGSDVLTTITGNGKFGINNTSPLDLLHLSPITATGDVYARISSTNGLTGLRLQNLGGDWAMYTNEFNNMFFGYSTNNFASTTPVLNLFPAGANFELKPAVNDQVFLGTSGLRWKEIWSVNALNTSSDRRLKKNIKAINYGLETVLALNPVSYNWKNNTDTKLHLGFIAQEVNEIVPEIVSQSKTTDEEFAKAEKEGRVVADTYGMEYTGLIPVLVKAIQEQQKMLDDNKDYIKNIEQKLAKFEAFEARLLQLESGKAKVITTQNADK